MTTNPDEEEARRVKTMLAIHTYLAGRKVHCSTRRVVNMLEAYDDRARVMTRAGYIRFARWLKEDAGIVDKTAWNYLARLASLWSGMHKAGLVKEAPIQQVRSFAVRMVWGVRPVPAEQYPRRHMVSSKETGATAEAVALLSEQVRELAASVPKVDALDYKRLALEVAKCLPRVGAVEAPAGNETEGPSAHDAQIKAYWRVVHRYVRTELGDTDYAARLDVGLAVVRKTDPPKGSHALIEELFVLLKFREHNLDEDAAESLHEGRSERPMTLEERLEHQGVGHG